MPIPRSSLDIVPTSFATVSVGSTNDPLEAKLKAISTAGFEAIELGFPDLKSFASVFHKQEIEDDDYHSLCSAGAEVKNLCKKYNLKILMLQPFSNFEGWPRGSKERDDVFQRAKGWIGIMQAVGTDMLQVGSTDSKGVSRDDEVIAGDLRQLADMLVIFNFRLCYENWCWATHAPTWKDVWRIVEKVNRRNVGLCLDTFHTAGGEYGDPTTQSGLIEHQGMQAKLMRNYLASCKELVDTVPAEKIFLLQISDAYKTPTPFQDQAIDGQRPRGRWSHDFRPYPFNGGYLTPQVIEFARAVLKTGARCTFSIEAFDGGVKGNGQGGMKGGEHMDGFCKGAMESLRRLLDACTK